MHADVSTETRARARRHLPAAALRATRREPAESFSCADRPCAPTDARQGRHGATGPGSPCTHPGGTACPSAATGGRCPNTANDRTGATAGAGAPRRIDAGVDPAGVGAPSWRGRRFAGRPGCSVRIGPAGGRLQPDAGCERRPRPSCPRLIPDSRRVVRPVAEHAQRALDVRGEALGSVGRQRVVLGLTNRREQS